MVNIKLLLLHACSVCKALCLFLALTIQAPAAVSGRPLDQDGGRLLVTTPMVRALVEVASTDSVIF